MYCVRKVNDDYTWIGADSRRLAVFEGVFGVPEGVSYNSYLLLDEKTVLFDTVDAQVIHQFRENLYHALDGRTLDYIVVHHMESLTTPPSWRIWCCASRMCRSSAPPWPRP